MQHIEVAALDHSIPGGACDAARLFDDESVAVKRVAIELQESHYSAVGDRSTSPESALVLGPDLYQQMRRTGAENQ